MKKVLRWGRRVAVLVVLVLVVLGVWVVWLAKTRVPLLDGTLSHAALTGETRIVRDNFGVPHISASNEYDAHFALGYAMGQDRLFQMEIVRRLAQGEVAELAGPLAVKVDAIVRAFRLKHKAEETVAIMREQQPEVVKVAEAFCAGLNFRQENEPLPFEFAILGIPAHTFTPADCVSVGALLPIAFADGMREDPTYTMAKARHPEMDLSQLFPSYSLETPATIVESMEEALAYLEAKKNAAGAPPAAAETPGPVSEAQRGAAASLSSLQALLDPFVAMSDLLGAGALGSNSWVVGPTRTKSKTAILCNDPHIPFTNPSVWYEAHLTYPGYDFYGYHLALIPFPLIGHDQFHSWSLTMLANDDIDLFQETFDPADPMKVKYKGEWQEVKIAEETVKVRFGADRTVPIRITPHGPLVTDFVKISGGYDGPEVSLAWVWQRVVYTDLLAFYRMARAKSMEEFQAAVSLVTSPGVNVSYADAAGNIAWWAAGKIPIRPEGVFHKSLLNGADGSSEVIDFVPFEQNPHLINPPCGFIATANNMPTVQNVGPIPTMQGYWQPGDRAARIEEVLASKDDWDVESLKALQFDDKGWAAPMVLSHVLGILEASGTSWNEAEGDALAILKKWDFLHGVDSAGASIYQYVIDEILRQAVMDEFGEQLFGAYTTFADHWNAFKYYIQHDDAMAWDNIDTPTKETRQEVVLKSFRAAIAKLQNRLGGTPDTWRWGRIHTMEFKHPFGYIPGLGRIFNVGPFESTGGAQIVNNMLYRPGAHKYDVLAGPSTRRIIDFGDPTHALSVLPTGNSGIFTSPNYGDQAEMFMAGKYRVVNFTPEQIAAAKAHEIVLQPAK